MPRPLSAVRSPCIPRNTRAPLPVSSIWPSPLALSNRIVPTPSRRLRQDVETPPHSTTTRSARALHSAPNPTTTRPTSSTRNVSLISPHHHLRAHPHRTRQDDELPYPSFTVYSSPTPHTFQISFAI